MVGQALASSGNFVYCLPDTGQEFPYRIHCLVFRRVFQLLNDSAANDHRIRYRRHRLRRGGVANAKANANRQLHMLPDRGDALRYLSGVDMSRTRHTAQ